MNTQRQEGRFYTQGNPFVHDAFIRWASDANLTKTTILEPFAGANGLVHHLEDMGLCKDYRSFDIKPGSNEVSKLDTLTNFPTGYETCVTNPPWLARNVATRLKMDFPDCDYQDLYAHSLDKCLANCKWVAALVPESFIRANLFRPRLREFISLTKTMFSDTAHPVGLALFEPNKTTDSLIWSGTAKSGWLSKIEAMRPMPKAEGPVVRFNQQNGNVGLLALDNTRSASIRFCDPEELANYQIRQSCRSITKLTVAGDIHIKAWNKALNSFREKTHDVLMTPFRGLRADGMYRRRCDWDLARGIIHNA